MARQKRNRRLAEKSAGQLLELAGEVFAPNERRLIGATDSAHHAVVGSIGDRQVFVKPFLGKRALTKATNELEVTRHVGALGFETTGPMRVIELRRHNAALYIAKYLPGMTGAHTLQYESDPGSAKGLAVMDIARNIVSRLGELHAEHVTHGDMQLKNAGFLQEDLFMTQTAPPYIFDFENGVIHDQWSVQSGRFANLAVEDLQTFTHSLGSRQFGGFNRSQAAEVMRDEVLPAYLLSSAGESLGALAISRAVDQAQASFLAGREHKSIHDIPLKLIA